MAQRGSARRCPTPRDRRPRVVAAQSCSPQSMRARRCPQTSTRARPGCAESRRRGCAVRGANRSRADGRERGVARERDALRAEAAEVQHHVARDENLLLQDVQPPHGSRLVDEHVIEHEHLGDVANPVVGVGARAEVNITHGQRAGVHARALVHAIDEQPERVGRHVVGPGPHLPQPGQIIPAIDQVEPGRNHPLRNAAPAYLPHLVALVVRHHRHAVRRRRRRVQHRDDRVTRKAVKARRRGLEQRVIHAIEGEVGMAVQLRRVERRHFHAGDLLDVVAIAGGVRPQAHGQSIGHANVVTAQPEAKTGDAGGIEHLWRESSSNALATTAHQVMRPRRRLLREAGDATRAIKLRELEHFSSPCVDAVPEAPPRAQARRTPTPQALRQSAPLRPGPVPLSPEEPHAVAVHRAAAADAGRGG